MSSKLFFGNHKKINKKKNNKREMFDKCNVTPVTATVIRTKENCFRLVELLYIFCRC